MAIKDVFNNSNDNYLKTGLTPCDAVDSNIFQFFPKKSVGISSGSLVLQSMDLSDLQIEINSWNQNKKVLESGEVTYVAGLTKELDNRSQSFDIGYVVPDASLLYMKAEIVINYNQNFKNTTTYVSVISDPSTGVNVENAVNLALSNLNIGVVSNVDSSAFNFRGNTPGYNFNVDSLILTNYDLDMNPSGLAFTVTEKTDEALPYAKYMNGAMLGVVLKATYPVEQSTYDKWLNISHVNNTFSFYEDPSYYTKMVDTGSTMSSTATTMSAGDYLNYITENDMWNKIGYLYMRINTFDQDNTAAKNLVPGFYVFNPHAFPVEIDYIMIA